ncbi:unnamed protein product, partial [Nesidiocoris tenuis]
CCPRSKPQKTKTTFLEFTTAWTSTYFLTSLANHLRQRLTIIADENRIPLTVSAYLCPFQVQTVPPPSAWAIYIEDSDLVKAYIIITILFQYRFRLGPYEEIPGEGMSLKNRKKRASSEVGHPHGTGKMGPPAPTRD